MQAACVRTGRRTAVWFAAIALVLAFGTPARAAAADLPDGIAASLRESGRALTSIVAADIDADGDVDVVATDTALNLLVWINDGTGRFTAKSPAPAHDDRTGAPRRDVEKRTPCPDAYTAGDPPSPHSRLRSSLFRADDWSRTVRAEAQPRVDRSRSPRSQRGPPASSPLDRA